MELFHDLCGKAKGGWDPVEPMGLREWLVQQADHGELCASYRMTSWSCQENSCKLQLMNLLQRESINKSLPPN